MAEQKKTISVHESIRQKTQTPKKKKKSGAAIKGGIVVLILIAVMVGYYYYLSNKEKVKKSEETVVTVAQELLTRNLETNYPPTVKEVIKYYSEITKCFYNEEYSDEEFEKLAIQARRMYDDDLVAANDYSKYIIELKSQIETYKAGSVRIASYSTSASTDVDYFEDDGFSFARIYATYSLVNGTQRQTVEEVYLLRKDEDGHWKIFGWDLAKNVHVKD